MGRRIDSHVPSQRVAPGPRPGPGGRQAQWARTVASAPSRRRRRGGSGAAAFVPATLEAAGCPFFCALAVGNQSHPFKRGPLAPAPHRLLWRRRLRRREGEGLGDMRSNRIVADITLFSGGATSVTRR